MKINKKLMITIPVVAGVLALGTGAGVAFAKSNDQSLSLRTAANYAAAPSPNASDSSTKVGYCGFGAAGGMMGLGTGQGLVSSQVAALLGTTTADLKTQLDSGKTLADLAAAKGISQDLLIQTIMAPFKDQMGLMLKYSYLTQDQINSMTQQMQDRLQALITSKLNPADENGWGFMEDMMDGYTGGTTGSYSGGMMGGLTNPSLSPDATNTPQQPGTGFRGMMSGNRGGMMGGW